ncbi:MAG: prolyl oligopeptidase family serine peptidase [Propionibacteriaceae bacterium]|nr:prolyl oligopeptidase family serine peptidase [Propionibacteriaceae bacterium]
MEETMIAPAGSWPSPVTPADLAGSSVRLGGGFADGGDLYWLVGDPRDRGRVAVFRRHDGVVAEVAPGLDARSRVHEYGGGAAAARDGVVVLTDALSGRVHVVDEGSVPRPITPADSPWRYGGFALAPVAPGKPRLVVCVREDHSDANAEPVDALVVLDLDSDNATGGGIFAIGADFYHTPWVGDDGRTVWMEWDHPNMPWDSTRIAGAILTPDSAQATKPAPAVILAGDGHTSFVHPTIAPNGSVVALADTGGFWNFYRLTGSGGVALRGPEPLHTRPWDFCEPPWVLDPPPYTHLPDGSIGCVWIADGISHLGRLDPDGTLDGIGLAASLTLTPGYPSSVATLGLSDRPGGLVALDWESLIDGADPDFRGIGDIPVVSPDPASPLPASVPDDESATPVPASSAETHPEGDYGSRPWLSLETPGVTALTAPGAPLVPPESVSRPSPLTWGEPGEEVHAWYYPPYHPGFAAPEGELPPLILMSHSGPTSYSPPTFSLKRQFFTTRGIGVLDVNYSGSSGYGRAYRDRLRGAWGVADVRDCSDAAMIAVERGLADPKRIAIMGGSAGGYTTLAALCFTDTFSAGISSYGIGDLEAMVTDTHKFEARYLDGLVAPYPAGRQTYLDRSPIHHLDGFDCPLLLLQGSDDAVVPPSQATAMADALEKKGITVTLVIYPGEGHGFRQATTIEDQYEQMLTFLGEVFGFSPG